MAYFIRNLFKTPTTTTTAVTRSVSSSLLSSSSSLISVQKRKIRLLSLSNLTPAPGSRQKKKRIGRGQGSGLGGSSTRGQRGQKARGPMGKRNFEGGQTPLFRRIPKRGFSNKQYKEELETLNIDKLVEWINSGRIDPNKLIDMKTIFDSNLLPRIKHGVKLLSTGAHKLTLPINIEVTYSSEKARLAVERAGGTIKYVYYNGRGLRAHLRPEKFAILPRSSGIPPPKRRHRYLDQFPNFVPIRPPTYHEYVHALAQREALQNTSSSSSSSSPSSSTKATPTKIPKSDQKSPKKAEKSNSTPSN